MKIVRDENSIVFDGEDTFILKNIENKPAIEIIGESNIRTTISNCHIAGYTNRKEALLQTLDHFKYGNISRWFIILFL